MTAKKKIALWVVIGVLAGEGIVFFMLSDSPKHTRSHLMLDSWSNLSTVGTPLRLYARENEGHLPGTLDELVPKYCQDTWIRTAGRITKGDTRPWQYHPGNTDHGSALTVIANSPISYEGEWLVLFGDFSVKAVPDEEFKKLQIAPP